MPYQRNYRRRRPTPKTGRGLKMIGAARIGRAAATVARNWRRVQPLTKRVAAGTAVTAGGIAGAGYIAGRRRKVYRRNRVPNSMADIQVPIKITKVLHPKLKPLDSRTLKLGFNTRTLRWQCLNTLNAGGTFPGAVKLNHATVSTDKTTVPMVLFCLNSTNNQASLTTGPAYYVNFNNTGGLELVAIPPQASDGTTSQNKWIVDYSSPSFNSGVTDPELRYILKDWYDIRLNCYGANNQPTIYDISVVSLTDDYLDPLETPSSAQEVADRHSVWQSMIQKYMSNPILPVVFPKKKFKVHSNVRFTLQPTLNIENDTTPQSRVVRMFIKDGQIYDYCYHGDGFASAGADDALSTVKYTVQGTSGANDYSDFPAAKARKWLVIRALNTTRITAGAETPANTPCFDLVVRAKEYCQAR